MVKALADKVAHRKDESELSSGMLYATGLVAGGSVAGVLIALVIGVWGDPVPKMEQLLAAWATVKNDPLWGGILCAVVFGVLCWLLFRNAQKKLEV